MQTEEFAFEGVAWSVSNSPKTISHQSLRVIYASTSAGAECPGFTTAGELQLPNKDPSEAVFCTHWCHRANDPN